MGRFVHEAVAVDPETTIVYLTEDRGESGFYRFIPRKSPAGQGIGILEYGGTLQVLAVRGGRNRWTYDTRTNQTMGEVLDVRWIDIQDPDPDPTVASDGSTSFNPSAVFLQGRNQGAALFSRLEGCWYHGGRIYFIATDGGDARLGQVWEYDPKWGGKLRLLFESPNEDLLDGPDNVCVSPRGGLVICEDGDGIQFVRGLTKDGKIFDFAQNLVNENEFAGACFSPDGQTLFVNIQGDTTSRFDLNGNRLPPRQVGMTFAIWGPWEKGAL
jgi:uncharacterized protein